MKNAIKGLIIGIIIGIIPVVLIGFVYLSGGSVQTESELGILLGIIFFSVLFWSVVCAFIGHHFDKKVKYETERKKIQNVFNNNRYKLNNILEQQFILANDHSSFNSGDYLEAIRILNEYHDTAFYNDLINIYDKYKDNHLSAIYVCLKNGGEANIRILINHLNHFMNMNRDTNNQLLSSVNSLMDFYNQSSCIADEKTYGKVNKKFLKSVNELTLNEETIDNLKFIFNKISSEKQLSFLNRNFVENLLYNLYAVVFKTPFDAQLYSTIYDMYDKYTYVIYNDGYNNYAVPSFDSMFTKIYAYYHMGKGVLKQISSQIDLWIKANLLHNKKNILLMASCMMWIGNYETELRLLRVAASNNIRMESNIQERLRFLESGGTSGPKLYEGVDRQKLNYDYSSISWDEKKFKLFFENLMFQDRPLTYCLAISEFRKTFKAKKSKPIKIEDIFNALSLMAKNEYMSEISCKIIDTNVLSENSSFHENTVLIKIEKDELNVQHAGIVVIYSCIGLNVNVQIISLFIPQQKLSIKENMELAIGMQTDSYPKLKNYLDSIKDSVAREIDKICEASTNECDIY